VKPSAKLFLIPVPITEENRNNYIPHYNAEIVKSLRHFIVEDAKKARSFLKFYGYPSINEAQLYLLNEHTSSGSLNELLAPLLKGESVGLMSDAGCPAIADPGSEIVSLAHKKNIEVVPLAGPSSIVLSIMASGFNGQSFSFLGYLPIDKPARQKRLKELENNAIRNSQAQFFIETPYRNDQLFDTLISTLLPDTKLFIGKNIGADNQFLKTKAVFEWKKSGNPGLTKIPVVFGIYKS
jgi:16S rRNA (cytidine1402-2'-O)-methyltransferase